METPSRVAAWSQRLGAAALALLALGPLLIHTVGAAPMVGFGVFQLGLLCGLLALVSGLVGLWITRPAGARGGRGPAVVGTVLGLAAFVVLGFAVRGAGGLPPINDITTNPDDPPPFVAAARLGPNSGRDLAYPGAGFAEQQRAAYPDLEPIRLGVPPERAWADARRVAADLGWEITAEDSDAGTLEATETTRIFRFVDDVVVRVRADGTGSVVDVRSKSRDGRGDLGANAARIRAFRDGIL